MSHKPHNTFKPDLVSQQDKGFDKGPNGPNVNQMPAHDVAPALQNGLTSNPDFKPSPEPSEAKVRHVNPDFHPSPHSHEKTEPVDAEGLPLEHGKDQSSKSQQSKRGHAAVDDTTAAAQEAPHDVKSDEKPDADDKHDEKKGFFHKHKK